MKHINVHFFLNQGHDWKRWGVPRTLPDESHVGRHTHKAEAEPRFLSDAIASPREMAIIMSYMTLPMLVRRPLVVTNGHRKGVLADILNTRWTGEVPTTYVQDHVASPVPWRLRHILYVVW
jgi:hypothetical protein